LSKAKKKKKQDNITTELFHL